MVRDSKDIWKWEDWEIRNTLQDIERDLKKIDITSNFLSSVYLGIIIGIFSGFFGSMLFSFFSLTNPNITNLKLGIFLLVFFILFMLFFYIIFRHMIKKRRALRDHKDILYFRSEGGQKEFLKALKEGKVKSFAEMSPEEIREMHQRSGGVEVEPDHWIWGKDNVKKWKKEK